MSIRLLPLTALLLITGCGDKETENDAAGDTPPATPTADAEDDCDDEEQANDCAPYSPTSESNSEGGSWSEANEHQSHIYTTPDDAGGGILTVSISSDDPKIGPWLTVDFDSTSGEAVTSNGAEAGETSTAVFEVGPGEVYTAEVHPWFNADEYPAGYTLTWSFEGLMDCYEPNDTPDQAKAIPTNEPVEAYALSPRTADTTSYDGFADWYTFTATHEGAMVELRDVPLDLRMGITLYNADDEQIGGVTASAYGEWLSVPMGVVGELVTLEVKVLASETNDTVTEEDEENPSHFEQPYTLLITDEE